MGIIRFILIFFAALLAGGSALARAPSPERIIPLEPYLRAQASVRATVGGVTGTFMFDTGEGLSTISPAFAAKIGCKPWGRVSGFRMSGERLNNPHCDNVGFDLAGEKVVAPAVTTVDVMKFIGEGLPSVDGALGLDLFAGKVITIVPRKKIIVESPASLAARIKNAREVPIRLVRDVEGLALSVDTAVKTPQGFAWMEVDTGNGGSMVIANHIAPLLGLATDMSTPAPAKFELADGIVVEGNTRTRDLIMDGNIGAQFLNKWNITLDLKSGRAWLSPADPS